jgi:phage-related protein
VAGKTVVLAVDIVADASSATDAFDKAGAAASGAAEKIDTVGGRSGDAASGLSGLQGALEVAGFGPAADAAGLLATGLDAVEGSTMLFKVAQESLNLVTLKNTVATIANTVATNAAKVAVAVWTAAQWLLNAALTANPIGLIIAGIALLIGAIVLIATKTTWFQDAWRVAWDAIKSAAKAVWDWFKDAGAAALDAIKGPIDAVKAAFDRVVGAIKDVIDWLKKIKLPDAIGKIGDFVGGIFGRSASSSGGAMPGVSASGMTRGGAGAGGTVNVFVPESSDPVATARYLKSLIRRGESAGVVFGAV